jgi:protein TonB
VPNGVLNSLLNAAQRVAAPPPPQPVTRAEPAAKPVSRISIGGNVQEAMLIHRVIPVYPQLARQARISGEVKYSAIISREGLVQSLTLMHGHPLLVAAALDAIRQWRYRPTILNGDPAEVVTTIIVTFTLN